MSCRLVYLIASVMFIMYFHSTNKMDGWINSYTLPLPLPLTYEGNHTIYKIRDEIHQHRTSWQQLDLRVAAVQKHDPTWGWNRPQVDRRRLGHIRLDLTSLDSGMWLESTSNDFTSKYLCISCRPVLQFGIKDLKTQKVWQYEYATPWVTGGAGT